LFDSEVLSFFLFDSEVLSLAEDDVSVAGVLALACLELAGEDP
jgi:hypothetical protein